MGTIDVTELSEIVVPENVTTEEMVLAGGYDYANSDITTANFPITSRGPRRLYLVHFKKAMDSKEVEQAVAQMGGHELAKVEDLLAVGAHPTYKDLQQKFPIFCLGSSFVWGGNSYVPYLDRWRNERWVSLDHDDRWEDACRFLLVGK